MEIKLKPCPFCGGEAGFRYWTMDGDWYVRCFTCKADIYEYDTKAEAAEAWNRRAERRAHWIYVELEMPTSWSYRCSNCSRLSGFPSEYCPYCGAKMDGDS